MSRSIAGKAAGHVLIIDGYTIGEEFLFQVKQDFLVSPE